MNRKSELYIEKMGNSTRGEYGQGGEIWENDEWSEKGQKGEQCGDVSYCSEEEKTVDKERSWSVHACAWSEQNVCQNSFFQMCVSVRG